MTDMDFNQKLRIMRLLWTNGYLVRKNVPVVRYDFGKRTDEMITDLDVLGIRFQFDFQVEKAIAYCTTSKKEKSKKLLFWLEGLKNHFDANKAYFVRSEILESKYMDTAMKFDISPISESNLEKLEEIYSIDKDLFIGPFNNNCSKKEYEAFKSLKDNENRVFYYLKVDFWVDKTYKKIVSLLHSLKIINQNSKIDNEKSFFLKMYCLSLLSLSIIEFSRPILFVKQNEREKQIKERILGGDLSYEKKRSIEGFYDFMKAEIIKKYNKKYDVPKIGFVEQFYPPYTKYLVDLINRFCNKPKIAIYVPNLIDLICYECGLMNNKLDEEMIKTFYIGNEYDLLNKIAKDLVIFAKRSDGITDKDYDKAINSLN